MAQFKCDICGGRIKMQPDKTGVCEECGMSYDLETLREMAKTNSPAPKAESPQPTAPQQTAPPQPVTPQQVRDPGINSTENAMIKPSEDPVEREVLVTYLDDVRTMETVIKESNDCLPKLAKERKATENAKKNWLASNAYKPKPAPVMDNIRVPIAPSDFREKQINPFAYFKEKGLSEGSVLRIIAAVIFIAYMVITIANGSGKTIFDSKLIMMLIIVLLVCGAATGLIGLLGIRDKVVKKFELISLAATVGAVIFFINKSALFFVISLIASAVCSVIIFTATKRNFKGFYLIQLIIGLQERKKHKKINERLKVQYDEAMKKYYEDSEKAEWRYSNAVSSYNKNEEKRKADHEKMVAEECGKFDAHIKEIDEFTSCVKADIAAVGEMLESEYSVNIIPTQFRNIHGAYYLYDYLSTSKQSLSEALVQFNLEAIKQKLDRMIKQNSTIILEQRRQGFQLGRIINLSEYIAANTEQIVNNTAVTAANTNVIAQNTAVIADNTEAIAANTSAIASNTSRMANDMAHMSANSDRIVANTGVAAAAAVGTYGEARKANATLSTMAANQQRFNKVADELYYQQTHRFIRY